MRDRGRRVQMNLRLSSLTSGKNQGLTASLRSEGQTSKEKSQTPVRELHWVRQESGSKAWVLLQRGQWRSSMVKKGS